VSDEGYQSVLGFHVVQTRKDHLLPYDGIAEYFPQVFGLVESQDLIGELLATIPWQQDEVVLFGTRRILSRKVSWHGEPGFTYAYSGTVKSASPWTSALLRIKARVEERSGQRFNSCLLNLYHDGSEGMGWHSDDEKTLGRNPVIASVSLGTARPFKFKHRITKEGVSVILENGSLLVMKGETQHHWVHALPKTKRVTVPRINLTFRYFIGRASPASRP
jgi:alkylated DNA repair dioxygenase AlkB